MGRRRRGLALHTNHYGVSEARENFHGISAEKSLTATLDLRLLVTNRGVRT